MTIAMLLCNAIVSAERHATALGIKLDT